MCACACARECVLVCTCVCTCAHIYVYSETFHVFEMWKIIGWMLFDERCLIVTASVLL